jgi:hypothetical protein
MIIAGKLLYPSIPDQLKKHDFTLTQFLIVIFSFFPFIEGFLAGQNHTLTLLLVSCITLFSISERWYLAGIAAGLLLYKPQFILGFLLVWLFGRKLKPLLAFAMVAIIWIGTFLLINGTSLFRDYFLVSSILLKLPFDKGFPAYLLTTPYGLVTSILPDSFWMVAYRLSLIFLIIYSAVIAWQADKNRKNRGERLIYLYCLAILFPLIATPYALLHDLLILIPLFVMFSKIHSSRSLLLLVVGTYLGGLLLPLAGYFTKLSITPLITIVITIYLIKVLLHKSYRTTFNNESYLGGEI